MSLIRRNEVYWGFLRSLFSPLSSSTSLSDLSRVKRKVQKINHTVEKCGLRTNPSERFCFLRFLFALAFVLVVVHKWFYSCLCVILTCTYVVSKFIIFACFVTFWKRVLFTVGTCPDFPSTSKKCIFAVLVPSIFP